MKGKGITLGVALLIAAALAAPGAAQARGIHGRCGEHWGAFYARTAGGTPIYHLRFGPRNGHVGGSMHCRGIVFVRRSGGTSMVDGFPGSWVSFDWLRWNLHTLVATNAVASACVGFGLGVAGEAPTGAIDTWLTASAGAGCVGGSTAIIHHVLTGGHHLTYCGSTANRPICNARVGMR